MFNQAGAQSVTLSTMGGLVTMAPSTSLSEGSSPLNFDVDFLVGTVFTRAGLSTVLQGTNNANFVWVKTFVRLDGTVYTLALDTTGALWQENVNLTPGTLQQIETVLAGDTAFSVTAFNREYFCLSQHDIPRQYDTINFDRISQVGPGASLGINLSTSGNPNLAKITAYAISANVVTFTANNTFTAGQIVQVALPGTALNGQILVVLSTGLSATQFQANLNSPLPNLSTTPVSGTATPLDQFPIASITQPPAGTMVSADWANGPGSTSAGNIYTIYYGTTPDNNLVNAFNAGIAVYVFLNFTSGNKLVNGTYRVTGIGIGGLHNNYYYFTCNAPSIAVKLNTAVGNYGTYQLSLATVTLASPVPGTTLGSTINISGATPTSWNGSWTIVQTPTGGLLTISQTSISGGTATYTFTVLSGSAPVPGDLVTVTNTTNGNGIFNVVNATVATVVGGQFTITGFNPAITFVAQVETGQAQTVGKIFSIDPGPLFVGQSNQTTPIFGNDSGTGTVVYTSSAFTIGPGTRQAVVMFLTRNGFLTKTSPPITFTIGTNASFINGTAIPLGPPDTIARWIAFTEPGANGVPGAFFYVIPTPVKTIVNGQPFTYPATVINDNTTTSAEFQFTDSILLASLEIDVPGANQFNIMELGSCLWNVNYKNRMFYGQVDNNIQNFLNLTFDGGYIPLVTSSGSSGSFAPDAAIGIAETGSPVTNFNVGTLTPTGTNDLAISVATAINNSDNYVSLGAGGPTGWTLVHDGLGGSDPNIFSLAGVSSATNATWNISGNIFDFYSSYFLLKGSGPGTISNVTGGHGVTGGVNNHAFGSNVAAGDVLLVTIQVTSAATTPAVIGSVSDSQGNTYVLIDQRTISNDAFGISRLIVTYGAVASVAGACTVSYNLSNYTAGSGSSVLMEVAGTQAFSSLPTPLFPLGWTADSVNGTGSCLINSSVFGQSYYIENITGSTQAFLGMATQPAFEDAYNAPIIQPNTTYSIRVAARCPSGKTGGNFVVDLVPFNTQTGYATPVGSFTVPFASLKQNSVTIQSGTLLTTGLNPVPQNLVLRIYATNIVNLADIEIDRIEIYPTQQPLLQSVLASYVNNPESIDILTGQLNVNGYNTQVATGGFVMYDQLYILKTSSIVSTQDSPNNEPSGWIVSEVSNKVGACGKLAYDVGEEWAVTACRSGLYVFYGKQPIKLSQEIFQVWEAINWSAGSTIWVKNDIVNRRILVGVPMATGPGTASFPYLPNAPVNANPTTPNVVLMLNYLGLGDVMALGDGEQMHTTMFGTLMSVDMRRKWSIWQIPSQNANFIQRPDGFSQTLFIGNGRQNGKIYQLLQSQQSDDGLPINSLYTTYGFVDQNKAKENPLLGYHRKQWKYLQMLLYGSGQITIQAIANKLIPPTPGYTYTVPPFTLSLNTADDYERPLNIQGNRVFLQFSTNSVGAQFNLERVILVGTQATLTLRGSAAQ